MDKKISSSALSNVINGHELEIGMLFNQPLNYVSPMLLKEVGEVLNAVTRHPANAISKAELQLIAEKHVGKVYIYERRLAILQSFIEQFDKQFEPLPPEDAFMKAYQILRKSFLDVINGNHK